MTVEKPGFGAQLVSLSYDYAKVVKHLLFIPSDKKSSTSPK